MKLLIVEDNSSVRRVLKTVVAPLADEIRECADGDEAVTIYRAELPDFVLMDIDLGDTDGIAATRRIREFDPHAKIIIVTNYDEADLREEARRAGACGYVLKENLLDVRIDFSLSGYKGANLYGSPPVSQRINCISGNPMGAILQIQTRGGAVNYNGTFDFYSTTWRTQSAWRGTCRRLTLSFNDGTTRSLDFRFR